MKRGDIVLVRQKHTPASKPRPCLLIQNDASLEASRKIIVCPLTSKLRGVAARRPLISPAPVNGLREPSEVQVDWIFTAPRIYVGVVIGSIGEAEMHAVDEALRRWLDL
jgi:mRNA interferase MazF